MGGVCDSCGIDMQSPEEYSQGVITSTHCADCCLEDGTLRDRDDIREGLIERFMESEGVDQLEAEEMVDAHMQTLPAWSTGEEE